MATILYYTAHGSDDPTKAGLSFAWANGAISAGHKAQIVLAGDAAILMKSVVAGNVQPVGWDPLEELIAQMVEHGVPIFV
jgi:predicted peroxiredoxin